MRGREIPLGRAVYCFNAMQIFRLSWMSDKLKKLLLNGIKYPIIYL